MSAHLTNITISPSQNEQSPEVREEALKIYSKADGLLRAYNGSQVEDTSIAYWIFEWESQEHEAKFLQDETLQPFFQKLQGNSAEGAINLRILFQSPDQSVVFTAPMTEICIATLKPGIDKQKFIDIAGDEMHQDPKSMPGMTAFAWGQVLEKEDQYVFAVGWESLEAHKEILSTKDSLKDAMTKIADICDLELRHVNLKIQEKL